MKYEGRLNKNEWIVKPIRIVTAYKLVKAYHYAASATKTGVYIHGLFKVGEEYPESKCKGVAWWLPPTKNAASATYPEGDFRKVLSLTRLVVSPDVPKNACSFMLMQSIKMIDTRSWECLVTYADTWQNHTGTIYRATNWEYMGLTKPSPVFQNEDGMMMGKKRGAVNLTTEEMNLKGFDEVGKFPKHKFRMILKHKKVVTKKQLQSQLF